MEVLEKFKKNHLFIQLERHPAAESEAERYKIRMYSRQGHVLSEVEFGDYDRAAEYFADFKIKGIADD